MTIQIYSSQEIDAIIAGLGGATGSPSEHWFRDGNGNPAPHNVLNKSMVSDQSGIINVDTLLPNVVPGGALSLILTVECGWLAFPIGGTGCVSLRIMPHGKNLSNVLDYGKTQEWAINNSAVDVVAIQMRIPIAPSKRTFFWALQSTHPAEMKKMAIIDLVGYAV